jgi:UDP:flavonoid glycosyltransferase YjiC (YdhE family)
VLVLFASIAAYGHVFPLVPLAVAAREAGHDVRFATAESFSPALSGAGLRSVPVSRPLDSTSTVVRGVRIAGAGIGREETLRRAGRILGSDVPREWVAALRPVLDDLRPDLVIHDVFNPGAALAARAAGIPALCHGLGRAPRGGLTSATERHVREYAEELGCRFPPGRL